VSEVEEKNKALVRRYYEEVWSKGNVAAIDEFMAAEYVLHSIPSGLPPGPEGQCRGSHLSNVEPRPAEPIP